MENEIKIQDKLNGEFVKSVVLIQSIYDDYVDTISELTGKTQDEIKKRIALKIKSNTVKFTEVLKGFTA